MSDAKNINLDSIDNLTAGLAQARALLAAIAAATGGDNPSPLAPATVSDAVWGVEMLLGRLQEEARALNH
jgi:hypothetical protein